MSPQDPDINRPRLTSEPVLAQPVISREPEIDPGEPTVTVGGGQEPKKEGWRSIISTLLILIAAPLVALVLITYVFQSYEVDGPSMENTLQNHDRLIVDKIPRTISRITGKPYIPKRADIVIFIKRGLPEFGTGQDKQLIKRVIGLPGDKVVVKDGKVIVYNTEHPNGFQPDLNPSYAAAIHNTQGDQTTLVKDGEIFVCGDNRDNSLDSRIFGVVPAGDIVGKLSYRIYPIGKAQGF